MGRAVYPTALVSATLRDPIWAKLPGSDPLALREDMEGLGLEQLPLCRGPLWATGVPCAIIAAHSGATWGPACPVVVPPWQLSMLVSAWAQLPVITRVR